MVDGTTLALKKIADQVVRCKLPPGGCDAVIATVVATYHNYILY